MPRYTIPGADRVSCQDPVTGRSFGLKLPHETEDPAEIRALEAAGAVMVQSTRDPKKGVTE